MSLLKAKSADVEPRYGHDRLARFDVSEKKKNVIKKTEETRSGEELTAWITFMRLIYYDSLIRRK